MVELGRVDIASKISLFSSHFAYPRDGHLDAALDVMAYLKQKHNSCLIFDPTYPDIDISSFPIYDWTEFYWDVQEAIPPMTCPNPWVKTLTFACSVIVITQERNVPGIPALALLNLL